MDQNVIRTVKKSYKKNLLYSVFSKEVSVLTSLMETNLKDVVFNLASAWDRLTTKTIVCSWSKSWPSLDLLQAYKKDTQKDKHIRNETTYVELNYLREAMFQRLVDNPDDLITADVSEWLEGAYDEQFQIMSDDGIIEAVAEAEAVVNNSDDEEG